MWDVETGARRRALWASSVPTFSKTQVKYIEINPSLVLNMGNISRESCKSRK